MSTEIRDNVIIIDPNAEHKLRVENISDMAHSLFLSTYQRAAALVTDIMIKQKKHNEDGNGTEKSSTYSISREEPYYNNIISFMGDRGSGKTSAMVTFLKFLKEACSVEKNDPQYPNITRVLEIAQKKLEGINEQDKVHIENTTFHNIGIIDPTVFHDKANIIEVVIARLFESFKGRLDRNSDISYEDKRKLLLSFQLVHKDLVVMCKDHQEFLEGEAIEVLSHFASSTRIREHLIELTKRYLDFMYGGEKSSYLVLAIDDPDQNTNHVYKMCESIRKYLIIPRLIILISAKQATLIDAIELDMFSDREINLYHAKSGDSSDLVDDYPREKQGDKAISYLAKLIPENRRLTLPFSGLRDKKYFIEFTHTSKPSGDDKDQENQSKKQLEPYLLDLIMNKTGLIFLSTEGNLHPIIPDNLRLLTHFISMLNSMDNVEWVDVKNYVSQNSKDEKCIKSFHIFKRNYERIWDYFVYQWIPMYLPSSMEEVVREFIKRDFDKKNEYIVTIIDRLLAKEKTKYVLSTIFNYDESKENSDIKFKNISEYNYIVDRANYSYNISLGDVLYILNHSLRFIDSADHINLIFALKTIYSLTLYEEVFINFDEVSAYENNISGSTTRKYNFLQRIIAGHIINPQTNRLIRSDKQRQSRRDLFKIDIDALRDIQSLYRNEYHELMPYIDDAVDMIGFYIDILKKHEPNYRKESSLFYDVKIASSTREARFNILSPFFNAESPDNVMFRIHPNMNTDSIIMEQIRIWRSNYNITAIPVYSIELIERLFENVKFDIKEKADFFDYYQDLYCTNLHARLKFILHTNTIETKPYIQWICDSLEKFPFVEFFSNWESIELKASILITQLLSSNISSNFEDELFHAVIEKDNKGNIWSFLNYPIKVAETQNDDLHSIELSRFLLELNHFVGYLKTNTAKIDGKIDVEFIAWVVRYQLLVLFSTHPEISVKSKSERITDLIIRYFDSLGIKLIHPSNNLRTRDLENMSFDDFKNEWYPQIPKQATHDEIAKITSICNGFDKLMLNSLKLGVTAFRRKLHEIRKIISDREFDNVSPS